MKVTLEINGKGIVWTGNMSAVPDRGHLVEFEETTYTVIEVFWLLDEKPPIVQVRVR